MSFFKVGQVGVLAAALAAPFVGNGCHKKDKVTTVNLNQEEKQETLRYEFEVHFEDGISENEIERKFNNFNLSLVEKIPHSQAKQFTILIESSKQDAEDDLKKQIQNIAGVETVEHKVTWLPPVPLILKR